MHKILWKIEELWGKYYSPVSQSIMNISSYYDVRGISRYYERFHQVDTFDFSESKEPVFTDDYGEYSGLQNNQVLLKDNKNIYLFDNHNEILYPILETALVDTSLPLNIVHIDAHPDDAIFPHEKPNNLSLDELPSFIKKTRISDFFDAVSESNIVYHLGLDSESRKLLGNIFRITHSHDFEFFLPPEEPYILSLDIDIFGSEGDFVDLETKVRTIAQAWSSARVVCIAMSPGFIDQEYAAQIVQIFTQK